MACRFDSGRGYKGKCQATGRYVVQVANHFTACVDGVILDAFNPGEKAVVGYYEMAEFDINK